MPSVWLRREAQVQGFISGRVHDRGVGEGSKTKAVLLLRGGDG